MTVVSVEVQNDFLEGLAAAKDPIVGVAELIWNGLDADAKRVDVTIERNEMGGIEVIRVRDDGHGIAHAEALDVFRKLGDSWKKREQRSKEERRILHGKDGQGRYKAFGVGGEIRWSTTFRDGDRDDGRDPEDHGELHVARRRGGLGAPLRALPTPVPPGAYQRGRSLRRCTRVRGALHRVRP